MVDRQDHITRILGGGPQTDAEKVRAQAEAKALDQAVPSISPALIEYLEMMRFGAIDIDTSTYPGSMDHVLMVSHGVTFAAGQRSVIEHLKALLGAQIAERS